jgi:drug/metabolite transporter (DMT)-like permease
LAVVFWTTGPVGSKAALKAEARGAHLTPLQVAFWAIGLGWLALLALTAARGRLLRLRDVSWRGWLVVTGMGLFGWVGYPVGINIAYTMLSLPEAMIISYLNPIFVVLLQGMAFGWVVRRVSGWEQEPDLARGPPVARTATGLLLCLLGVAWIATGGDFSALDRETPVIGALAALFAAFAWAVYSNLGRFVAVRPGREASGLGDIHNLGAMFVGLLAMGIGLALTGRLGPPAGFRTALYLGAAGPALVDAWVPISVMALLNYGLGYTIWLYALEGAGRVGQAYKLPPLTNFVLVSAIGLGWLILRESIGPGFWEGAALIAAGNVVALWPARTGDALRAPVQVASEPHGSASSTTTAEEDRLA